MLKNYLKIAWRNLMKNKVFSFINIFGLSVGLACCILITLYIFHETGYDKYHKNGDRIYRLGTVFIDQGIEERGGNTSAPLGRMLQQEYPEVEASARTLNLFRDDKTLFQVKENNGELKSFYETILSYKFK
jgi:putative ABC transport system permease protein